MESSVQIRNNYRIKNKENKLIITFNKDLTSYFLYTLLGIF